MKILVCLPILVSALVLALGLGIALPSGVMAADPLGTPARPDSGTFRDRDVPQQAVPQNENYRANYFIDYHANPGGPATGGSFVDPSHPANNRESIGRRDVDTSTQRSPFSLEMSRFRGEMSNWRR